MRAPVYRRYGKRCFDTVAAAAALLALAPVLGVTAILVRWRLGAPILFRQQRPGLHGELFTVLKFRTMTDACDRDGEPLPDDRRLTRFGKFLRSASLDELPELWNVLRGDMSLVGPRPWLPQYLRLYTPEQARRHDVRPGITGWAQINGRNRADWADRLDMDLWYVERHSFRLDVKILALTVVKVLRRADVQAAGHATMTEFSGTPAEGPSANVLPLEPSSVDSAERSRLAG